MRIAGCGLVWLTLAAVCSAPVFAADVPSVTVGVFPQEMLTVYTTQNGLPADAVRSVAIGRDGVVYAGTDMGLARFAGESWSKVPGIPEQPIDTLLVDGHRLLFIQGQALKVWNGANPKLVATLPDADDAPYALAAQGETIWLGTKAGLYRLVKGHFQPETALKPLLASAPAVRQIAAGPNGELVVAAQGGLFERGSSGKWKSLEPWEGPRYAEVGKKALWAKEIREPDKSVRKFPVEVPRSWAPRDVRGVAFDRLGRLWFASPQGVGCYDGKSWNLYTGRDGLPYNDFTTVVAGEKGSIWFGTHMGAIKYDGVTWEYREGRRWLPDDDVHAMAVDKDGNAWFATSKGLGEIARKPMTLAEKAKFYENQIDKYHRRTPYGFVAEVSLDKPGDTSVVHRHDNDNDGLWTSMYGAGECFAYAATKDPKARERAKKAFEALRFLGLVTQGCKHAPPLGFVARSIRPTSGPNPNKGLYEANIRERATSDKLCKVYKPRWPKSKDGKWYWKSDTSSDELDGHYFFYPLYYDLVCKTEQEKAAVRKHVRQLTDDLINHDFDLVDFDGTPTRWGYYDPQHLNHNVYWVGDRGLKCLSMLSYLAVAEHITGDPKYDRASKMLRDKYGYDINAMISKISTGIGSGNQSDDEMGFMCYYNLIKYTKDPKLKHMMQYSFMMRWIMEEPEMNPFFNFTYAASCLGAKFTDPWGTYDLSPWSGWLKDSVDTLKRFPLDLINWRQRNIQRLDIVPLPRQVYDPYATKFEPKGLRTNGKVIPVDECFFNHWNRDPYELNTGGDGRELADGTIFTLPYYMGLYHGFIK